MMNQDDYFKLIKEVNENLVSASEYLKQRILNNSSEIEPVKDKKTNLPIWTVTAFTIAAVFAFNFMNKQSESFVVDKNYIANFDLSSSNIDNISYIEVELPEDVSLVSEKLQNKKKFIFVWSVFSNSKIVSFPFKASKGGEFFLKINILNDKMEVMETKSMKVDIARG